MDIRQKNATDVKIRVLLLPCSSVSPTQTTFHFSPLKPKLAEITFNNSVPNAKKTLPLHHDKDQLLSAA
jgi:hypothetical protein